MPHRPTYDHASEIHQFGLKATTPRIKVLRLFQEGLQRHWSVEAVYRKLLEENAEIGLPTIYRVLMQFVQAGLLSSTHIEPGKANFELNEGRHHDHLVCLNCGKVDEFCNTEIKVRQRCVAEQLGFELRDHALLMYGVCSSPECRRDPH